MGKYSEQTVLKISTNGHHGNANKNYIEAGHSGSYL
jgi:hypothetical protein